MLKKKKSLRKGENLILKVSNSHNSSNSSNYNNKKSLVQRKMNKSKA